MVQTEIEQKILLKVSRMDAFLKRFSPHTPRILKWARRQAFRACLPFIVKKYQRFYFEKIYSLEEGTQLFFLGREDYGTHLHHLNYVRLWQLSRGKAAIVIFTVNYVRVLELVKYICPETQLIYPKELSVGWPLALFGSNIVIAQVLTKIYPQLAFERRDALNVWYPLCSGIAEHWPQLDLELSRYGSNFSKEYSHAYNITRRDSATSWCVKQDYFMLSRTVAQRKIEVSSSVLNKLGCTKPYVVVNINVKSYGAKTADRRSIHDWERYNVVIDTLIKRGFAVIQHGREEQPLFKPRQHFYDYARSDFISQENDLALFNNCVFAICSKSGSGAYASICDTPLLGLDYVEPSGVDSYRTVRFYPKYMKNNENGEYLTWKSLIKSPAFFNMGIQDFGGIKYDYEEMSEEDLLVALEEFLLLVEKPKEQQSEYTERQQQYKDLLTPLHLDPYYTPGVPLDCYLRKFEGVLLLPYVSLS